MNNSLPEVVNVSGSGRTVVDTVRPAQHRDTSGRYRTREARLAGPYLNQPSGQGGIDAVTGEFRASVRDNSSLFDMDRVHAISSRQMQFATPDNSRGASPARRSNDDVSGMQATINHVAGCKACATGGACNG